MDTANRSRPVGACKDSVATWVQPQPNKDLGFSPAAVIARRRTLLKIVRKHICDPREPWERLLPDDLLTSLRNSGGVPGRCGDDLLTELAEVIETVARHAAERPLLLRHRTQEVGAEKSRRWSVVHVTRPGAYVVVDVDVFGGPNRQPVNLLKTCFLPTPHPRDQPSGNAWRTVAQRLLYKWSEFDPRVGAFRISRPEAMREVPQRDGPPVLKWQPQFLSGEAWGVRELPDGGLGVRGLPRQAW